MLVRQERKSNEGGEEKATQTQERQRSLGGDFSVKSRKMGIRKQRHIIEAAWKQSLALMLLLWYFLHFFNAVVCMDI